jgi:hypothetical protein
MNAKLKEVGYKPPPKPGAGKDPKAPKTPNGAPSNPKPPGKSPVIPDGKDKALINLAEDFEDPYGDDPYADPYGDDTAVDTDDTDDESHDSTEEEDDADADAEFTKLLVEEMDKLKKLCKKSAATCIQDNEELTKLLVFDDEL